MGCENNEIFTIGYSSFQLDVFFDTLKKYEINAVVDVRSSPYSLYKPEFNRDSIKKSLTSNKIAYVFLGEECGARLNDSKFYINGKVSYDLVAESPVFKGGLERIKKGMETHTIVLMCAEKDPITCHRTILISRKLSPELAIKHILGDGSFEYHEQSEQRLLKLFNPDQLDMFNGAKKTLDDAYTLQAEKISYEVKEHNSEGPL